VRMGVPGIPLICPICVLMSHMCPHIHSTISADGSTRHTPKLNPQI
jgi:hypothetical protein